MKIMDFMKFDTMMKGWDELDDDELKIVAVRGSLIGFLECSVFALILFGIFKNVVFSLSFVVAGVVVAIPGAIILLKRDWLDEKIGLFDPDFSGFSYQGLVLFMIILGLCMSCVFFGGAYNAAGIYSAIAFGFVYLIPTCFMLLRWNVFNNDSRWLFVEDEYGNISYEKVMGYNPLFYFLVSFICCAVPLAQPLKRILEHVFLGTSNLAINVFFFIISTILCFLIMSPDIMNDILPFEVKTADGMIKCGLILAFCSFLIGLVVITV